MIPLSCDTLEWMGCLLSPVRLKGETFGRWPFLPCCCVNLTALSRGPNWFWDVVFSLGSTLGRWGALFFLLNLSINGAWRLSLCCHGLLLSAKQGDCEISSSQMCSVKPTGEHGHSWPLLELEKCGLIYLLLQIILHGHSNVERSGLSFWHAVIKNGANISHPIAQRKRILCESVKLNLKMKIDNVLRVSKSHSVSITRLFELS